MIEPWIERVIADARDRGMFDNVPGQGEPIPDLDEPYDPAWWARRWVERERRRDRARDLERRVATEVPVALASCDEAVARGRLEDLSAAIRTHNETAPDAALPGLDVAGLLAGRRMRRRDAGTDRGDWSVSAAGRQRKGLG
jgi:hypothetical protein